MAINRKLLVTLVLGLLVSESMIFSAYVYPPIVNKSGVLVFRTFDDIQATLGQLELEYADNVKAASAQFATNDPEKWTDDQVYSFFMGAASPLGNLEKTQVFTSLRQTLEASQKALYANFGNRATPQAFAHPVQSDPLADPINHFIEGPFLQSLYNAYLEIGVGNSFYRASPDGLTEYTSFEALVASRPVTRATSVSVSIAARLLQQRSTCCTCNKYSNGSVFAGTRAIVWRNGHTCWPSPSFTLLRYASAMTINYRYIKILWWGFWVMVPRWTTTMVFGNVTGVSYINCVAVKVCQAKVNFNPGLASNSAFWFWVGHTRFVNADTYPGWVQGQHNSWPVPNYTSTLWF